MSTTFRITLSPAHISADLCPVGFAFFFAVKKKNLKPLVNGIGQDLLDQF